MSNATPVNLALDSNEALVLFEFLARANSASAFGPLITDQAEQRVLWNVEALLERVLGDIVAPDYGEKLAAARDAVRDVEV